MTVAAALHSMISGNCIGVLRSRAADFLWALVDEGIVRTDFDGRIDVNGVNAPDGVVGPHREKEGSFWAIREIFSPVKIQMANPAGILQRTAYHWRIATISPT